MFTKVVTELANSVDPDQSAPQEQSDLDLQCLLRYISPDTLDIYSILKLELIGFKIKKNVMNSAGVMATTADWSLIY